MTYACVLPSLRGLGEREHPSPANGTCAEFVSGLVSPLEAVRNAPRQEAVRGEVLPGRRLPLHVPRNLELDLLAAFAALVFDGAAHPDGDVDPLASSLNLKLFARTQFVTTWRVRRGIPVP